MCRTSTPGTISWTGGQSDEVARVKISTSIPRAARVVAVCATYTFIPPASPVPGCASGDVCSEMAASRRSAGREFRVVT